MTPENALELERLAVHMWGREVHTFMVTGSQTYTDWVTARDVLLWIYDHVSELPKMLNGKAFGADSICASMWLHAGAEVEFFKPDYNVAPGLRKQAPLVRNMLMVDQGPDFLLVFRNGFTPGTQYTWSYAEEQKVPCFVFNQNY